MKNEFQQFHNAEFGNIDILLIDGKPYFPATECAIVLGHKNPRKAIIDRCKGVTKRDSLSAGGVQERNYIPEGDLYRLIIRSKLPAAVRFEAWVCDEILPTIRKYGAYVTADTPDEMLRNPKFTEAVIGKPNKERERSAALPELAEEMAPKALYCDLIPQSKSVIPVSLIAKDYGMTAAAFNSLLHDLGIQFRIAGTWLPYRDCAAKSHTQTRTCHVGERTSAMHTFRTQKGRLFLYETLKIRGILPVIEKKNRNGEI
ncbi:MAG: phage antirepressor KilAC domain-containing protein [Clostridiales Family XIII bacterium]|jgi:prophage antirepressor-like protein|nr:phage antirepressor KilAC domain-containing protein [Clostridiales Family XIII bacterium]